jgi:uncharacterized protein YutE (UPF0331/DUF86 family)
MTADRIDRINERLAALREYVVFLQKQQHVTSDILHNDPTIRGAIERYLHLACEAVLDIANQLIAEYRYRAPNEYKEAIMILGEEGILEKDFAKQFAPIAGFRNILVHDYLKINEDEIVDKIQNHLQDFDTFAKSVATFLS